jgi:hypothetical protein
MKGEKWNIYNVKSKSSESGIFNAKVAKVYARNAKMRTIIALRPLRSIFAFFALKFLDVRFSGQSHNFAKSADSFLADLGKER